MNDQRNQSGAPQGAAQAPAAYFTGGAWVKPRAPAGNPTDCVVSGVTFEPGARNNWHSHPHGQVLVAPAGTGYYRALGQPARRLHPGAAVSIAPNVVHWRGGAPKSRFAHLATNPNARQGLVVWRQPATNAEYPA